MLISWRCWFAMIILSHGLRLSAQPGHFFVPADTFQQDRFWISAGTGTAIYGGIMVALQQAWYAQAKQTGFHTFNDWGEWRHMDKMGHIWTTYNESRWLAQGARWTGMSSSSARWTGVGVAMVLQTSIEVLDAFSAKWGFSWSDIGANTLGAGIYATQDWLWQEQRILIKVSNTPSRYPSTPIVGSLGGISSLQRRAHDLYGQEYSAQFLKDYNGMNIWFSLNPSAFCHNKPSWLPSWLNIAAGISGEHLYGGYSNQWVEGGEVFSADPSAFPRLTQFFLSPDIDLTRIPVRSPFWRTVLHALNFVKIPAPALSVDSKGRWAGHWLYF